MYSYFNVKIDEVFLSAYYEKGKEILQMNVTKLEECLEKYVDEDGSINGEALQADWFGPIDADVFISHSHKDEATAIALAGWLQKEMNLTAFVDSCVWGYANNLLDKINRKYNIKRIEENGSITFRHEDVLYSASHVHMMLCTALNKMLDKSESIFFLNTENSLIKSAGGDPKTDSPWIYLETTLANTIERHTPGRIAKSLRHDEAKILYEDAGLRVNYPVNLDKFASLNEDCMSSWQKIYCKSRDMNALDVLYMMCDLWKYEVF